MYKLLLRASAVQPTCLVALRQTPMVQHILALAV